MAFLDSFPSKYSPRETQKDVINEIDSAVKSGFRNILLCVPTGVGKSHIAVTAAKYLGTSFIITAQKILQDQYTNDFDFIYPMKGKPNFPCMNLYDIKEIPYGTAKNDSSLSCTLGNCSWEEQADDGTKRTEYCKFKPKIGAFSKYNVGTEDERIGEPDEQTCYYYNQKYQALHATHALFNYSSYFQTRLFNQGIDELLQRDCLIADEAHEIEDQIIGYIGFDVRPRFLEDVGRDLNDFDTDEIDGILEMLEDVGNQYTKYVRRFSDDDDRRAQTYRRRRDKIDNLFYEIKYDPDNFVIQESQDSYGKTSMVSIKPIEIGNYIGRFFDRPHQIFLSATINLQMFCRTMNIPESDCAFIEVPRSPFSVSSRKIHFHNVRKLNYRSTDQDYNAMFAKIKEILELHPDEKGLILTTTKRQCQDIANYFGDRIVVAHEGAGEGREEILQRHKNTSSPDVLTSPSFWYGVDLKDDLSRFQIILKAPYPSMGDRRTKIKSTRDPLWYQNKTMEKLLQGFGRSVRNDKDYAETHVLDESVVQVLERMKRFVPKAYYDSLGWQ